MKILTEKEIEQLAEKMAADILKGICKAVDAEDFNFSVSGYIEGALLEATGQSPLKSKKMEKYWEIEEDLENNCYD